MHTDSRTAGRNHLRNSGKRQECHSFKEHCKLRVLVHELCVHVRVFRRAGHKERNPIMAILLVVGCTGDRSVFCVFVAVVIFDHAEKGELIHYFVRSFFVHSVL